MSFFPLTFYNKISHEKVKNMSEIIKHKRVEFTELFYDLVLVYAIAKSTGMIYHTSHGIVAPIAYLTFITCLLVLINTWMIQTVFTNRYGKKLAFQHGHHIFKYGYFTFVGKHVYHSLAGSFPSVLLDDLPTIL